MLFEATIYEIKKNNFPKIGNRKYNFLNVVRMPLCFHKHKPIKFIIKRKPTSFNKSKTKFIFNHEHFIAANNVPSPPSRFRAGNVFNLKWFYLHFSIIHIAPFSRTNNIQTTQTSTRKRKLFAQILTGKWRRAKAKTLQWSQLWYNPKRQKKKRNYTNMTLGKMMRF